MYRIIDDVLSEDDLVKIEQNVLQAPIFKAFESTASSQSDNVYDVMMSRVFFSSFYSKKQLAGFDEEYLPYFYPLLNKFYKLIQNNKKIYFFVFSYACNT